MKKQAGSETGVIHSFPHSVIHSLTHSFNKGFLTAYYMHLNTFTIIWGLKQVQKQSSHTLHHLKVADPASVKCVLFSYFNREILRLNKIKKVLLLCDKSGENIKDDWVLLPWIPVFFDGLEMYEWAIRHIIHKLVYTWCIKFIFLAFIFICYI